MKKFKLKFLSLVLCTFMLLSVFTGCSLFVSNKDYGKNDVVMTVGDEKITKDELSQLYYSFYSQNSSYFYYYDEDQIADIFYRSVVSNKITLQQAKKLRAEGKIAITNDDYDDIWESVFDYFYSQVDSAEKSILKSKGATDDDLPERLQSSSSNSEKAYKLEKYEWEEVKIPEVGEEGTEPNIENKIEELTTSFIFKYNTSKDEENPIYENISEEEKTVRTQAYRQFVSSLILSAKSNNKNTKESVVVKEEVQRVYKSYFESKLQEKYKNYINATSADAENNCYSDEIIAKKYLNLLNASTENNSVEDNYVEIISSTSNDTLILYHYKGKYTFFTVQHLLVAYDFDTIKELNKIEGYKTVRDKTYRDYYEQYRKAVIGGDEGILNMETSYRNDEGYIEKDADGNELKVTIAKIKSEFEAEAATRLQALNDAITADVDGKYASMTDKQIELERQRVRTLLFNEYAWKYSDDTGSLTNDKLAGILGYTISSQENNHGSLVKDFANYAREMFNRVEKDEKKIGEEFGLAVTDYGVHCMIVTGEYTPKEVVSTTGKTAQEIVSELKSTYVSNLSNQTLYEYIYDLVKDNTIGDNGTFYSDHLNKMIKDAEDAGKIKYEKKYSYHELNELIG